ncbi:DUF4179 domain-containing protein [Clostridium ihumii]|uniref:DUF4179 domain-containing protein n=1 Tax=Clostridium ihumii TaxID=1470356 RepID=UPI00058F9570|nr:DUF4179 domain-containing protein [Clostridium ihumii]
MDKFDEMIKKNAANESCELPESLENRMEETFKSLDKVKKHKRVSLKVLVSVATIMTLTFTTVMATNSDIVKQAINSVKGYFESNTESKYASNKEEIEEFGSEVGVTVEDNGIKITLDSISTDGKFINTFYTIESDKPIPKKDNPKEKPMEMYSNVPFFFYEIDGVVLGDMGWEGHYESENILKAVVRVNLDGAKVNENSKLNIATERVFDISGKWNIETTLNKGNFEKDVKNFTVNKKADIDLDGQNYNMMIESVSMSPLGNQITFDSLQNLKFPFVILDDKGNSLEIVGGDQGISDANKKSIEFICENKDTKYIKIIPLENGMYDQSKGFVMGDLENYPIELKTNSKGSILVENVEFGKNDIKIKYKKSGLSYYDSEIVFDFADCEGNEVEPVKGLREEYVDRKDGSYNRTITYYVDEYDFSNYKKIMVYPETEYKLLEDKAIQIDLQ